MSNSTFSRAITEYLAARQSLLLRCRSALQNQPAIGASYPFRVAKEPRATSTDRRLVAKPGMRDSTAFQKTPEPRGQQ
jgi:hypothetical protein